MQALFSHLPGLLKMSGQASILILLVLAAQWLCGRRLQPRWRCALWLLVLLRLALPWTLPSPASLYNVLKLPAAAQHTQPETAPTPMMDAPISTAEGVAVAGSSAGGYWLAWLWAAGALCLANCATVNHYKIHRRVTRRRPLIDGPTLNLLEDCKALMGVRTPVTLIETEAIESPTLFGFVRPRLLLPAGLASSFTRQELRHVFLHELAHIKRHDVLAGWVMLGLQTLHWFNPLVWLAFHRLRADRELACDALALSYARPGENESYGLTIIKLLERFGQSVWAPSLAGILENKQQMKERISMIAKFHKTDRGLALAVSLFAGLALVTLTDAHKRVGS
jgi:bla regulator protein BlaR1